MSCLECHALDSDLNREFRRIDTLRRHITELAEMMRNARDLLDEQIGTTEDEDLVTFLLLVRKELEL